MNAAPSARPPAPKAVRIDTREQATPEVVEQDDLKRIYDLQMKAWKAMKLAVKGALQLRGRIASGARLKRGKYRWDADLERVTDGTI